MWLLLAVLSTLFIGVSSILSKIGIKDADPYVTGAVTNTVLLAAFAVTAAFTESFGQVQDMGFGTWVSVAASGIVLSVSWAFYFLGFRALLLYFLWCCVLSFSVRKSPVLWFSGRL